MKGCCSSCGGTGSAYIPETNGRCWDCYGTGCAHEGPCPEWITKILAAWMIFWLIFFIVVAGICIFGSPDTLEP